MYTDTTVTLPVAATHQMLAMLEQWQSVFPREETFVYRTYGVPCLFVRFDGVWDASAEKFRPYEIQEGCGWIGYASLTNPEFKSIRDELITSSWPSFKLLIHEDLIDHDDTLWIDQIRLDDALNESIPLQIRYPLSKYLSVKDIEKLSHSAIRSIRFHLSKEYGVTLGWWKEVQWSKAHLGDILPWDIPFVLKPRHSFGSVDVMVWNPENRAGRATRTQIVNTLEKRGAMYCQPLIAPIKINLHNKPHHLIHRPFFGYDTRVKKWIPMHGVWTARPAPNFRIHGSSDAISGPLLMES